MIVGNKVDKESSTRQVTREEGLEFARKMGTLFIESSAKTRQGVKEAFTEVNRKIVETPSLWQRGAAGVGTSTANKIDLSADAGEGDYYSYCSC